MWTRLQITIFLALAVIVWAVLLLVRGTPISWDYLWPFSLVVGFLGFMGMIFEHVLWRNPALHGWFVKRPDLRGTWCGELQSDWVGLATAQQNPPIKCYMGVEQSFSRLQMHLMTPESESWFIADSICTSSKGSGYRVVGVYTNQPQAHLRGNRSEIHLGTLVLDTHGRRHARPKKLMGEYWTDRKTKGTITLFGRVDRVYTCYDDADRMLGLLAVSRENV